MRKPLTLKISDEEIHQKSPHLELPPSQKTKKTRKSLMLKLSDEIKPLTKLSDEPKPSEENEKVQPLIDEITENMKFILTPEKIKDILDLMKGTEIVLHRRYAGNKKHFKAIVYKKDDRLIKIYNYNTDIIEKNIIKEIAYQKFAETLNEKCHFYTPKIMGYGKMNVSGMTSLPKLVEYDSIMFIEMEYLNYNSLAKNGCDDKLNETINDIKNCMGDNNLFHNDLHANNIFLDENKIAIIDYGEASSNQKNPAEFNCHIGGKKTKRNKKRKIE
jgi:tRNA A-37 threonylcarbamoyl transferase component Bud32